MKCINCNNKLPDDWHYDECHECLAKPDGCGKFIYHHVGKGNVHCQKNRLCKSCSQNKTKEKKKEVKNEERN